MKKTIVTLAGGAGFTNIPVTQPSHFVRVRELASDPVGLIAEFPDDAFANQYNFQPGAFIMRSGNGLYGILGRQANFQMGNTPASADLLMKLKASNNSALVQVMVEEYGHGEGQEA